MTNLMNIINLKTGFSAPVGLCPHVGRCIPGLFTDTETLCNEKKEERERFINLVANTMVRDVSVKICKYTLISGTILCV